jgi:hypothetical protein
MFFVKISQLLVLAALHHPPAAVLAFPAWLAPRSEPCRRRWPLALVLLKPPACQVDGTGRGKHMGHLTIRDPTPRVHCVAIKCDEGMWALSPALAVLVGAATRALRKL